MLELIGLAIGGLISLCILGVIFRFAWLLFSLILLPFKLLVGLGAALLAIAAVIFVLPAALVAALVVLGVLGIAALGACLATI